MLRGPGALTTIFSGDWAPARDAANTSVAANNMRTKTFMLFPPFRSIMQHFLAKRRGARRRSTGMVFTTSAACACRLMQLFPGQMRTKGQAGKPKYQVHQI